MHSQKASVTMCVAAPTVARLLVGLGRRFGVVASLRGRTHCGARLLHVAEQAPCTPRKPCQRPLLRNKFPEGGRLEESRRTPHTHAIERMNLPACAPLPPNRFILRALRRASAEMDDTPALRRASAISATETGYEGSASVNSQVRPRDDVCFVLNEPRSAAVALFCSPSS